MRLTFPVPKQAIYGKLGNNRFQSYSMIIIALLIVPMLLVIAVEYIQRGSLSLTLDWVNLNHKLFFVNYLINFFVFLFIYCLLGSLVVSMGVTTMLMFLVSLINFFKIKLIGEPFFPWDVLLNKEGMNIIPLVSGSSTMIKILGLSVIVICIFLLRLIVPRLSMHWIMRVTLGLLSIFILYSVALKTPWAAKLVSKMDVNEVVWNQRQSYSSNGLAIAFTLNVKNSIVPKPSGYEKEAIEATAKAITETAQSKSSDAVSMSSKISTKQPNVIFIMNEAFWDPTLLPNVTFSEDPIPTVHRLQKEHSSGYMLSPQFGGGTSNVEFEVLTGFSTSFLPGGSIAYQQYINKPTPTLASLFEGRGYKSMGIHPYEGWFWSRNTVYKEFGFESFKSKDYFVEPEIKGTFISDDEVSRSIIKEIDETENPMFIYAVTMQNHGPYADNRYGSNPIKATGNLTPDAKNILETYTQGAHDADKALQLLIDHYEQSDEPTMIVFYGDHLPMLGLGYEVYEQGGFISTNNPEEWSLEELKKMRSIPLVTWSNFSLPKDDLPIISSSFLGGYVLDALQIEKPGQFAVNNELYKKLPGMINGLSIDANLQLHKTVPEELESEVEAYRNVQYDLLFGKQYLAEFMNPDFLNTESIPTFNFQFDDKQENSSSKQ
ncbi:LTA synthase family protein [Paenibacillus eucommiae]|uniref:Phosphoglycerol transferase MdoB-like AlkP superfamily enzyme n=1 Tax=Paenibacillus eucommiae TaxID=1355755 RepID=A0ABS4IZK7_9BACL|nr:alkaline phosphatase family protein [Paenibacillus eucommiae]MBP1992416.1 phosphoglycerol transferase MdoB-like AlkP superfamily enzyme [Paenibacillus eucommiae]